MEKNNVKNELLKEFKDSLKNPIFKAIIKRCSVLIFTIDFDNKQITFEFKKFEITLFKKSFKLPDKYNGFGVNIYEFTKDEILNDL